MWAYVYMCSLCNHIVHITLWLQRDHTLKKWMKPYVYTYLRIETDESVSGKGAIISKSTQVSYFHHCRLELEPKIPMTIAESWEWAWMPIVDWRQKPDVSGFQGFFCPVWKGLLWKKACWVDWKIERYFFNAEEMNVYIKLDSYKIIFVFVNETRNQVSSLFLAHYSAAFVIKILWGWIILLFLKALNTLR